MNKPLITVSVQDTFSEKQQQNLSKVIVNALGRVYSPCGGVEIEYVLVEVESSLIFINIDRRNAPMEFSPIDVFTQVKSRVGQAFPKYNVKVFTENFASGSSVKKQKWFIRLFEDLAGYSFN